MVEGTPEYEVESIKDSRRRRGRLEYLVHWKGYPREEDTWIPVSNVKNAPELVRDFHHRNPDRPAPTNNIRLMCIINPDERLFDELDGVQGEGFRSEPIPDSPDVILTLTTVQTIDLMEDKEFPIHIPPDLLTNVKRVWICELDDLNCVTCVVRIHQCKPLRLYYLHNPVPWSHLTRRRDHTIGHILKAPYWLNHDYGSLSRRQW